MAVPKKSKKSKPKRAISSLAIDVLYNMPLEEAGEFIHWTSKDSEAYSEA